MNLSLKEKSLWISLGATMLFFGYYFFKVSRSLLKEGRLDDSFIGFFITVVIFAVATKIVLHWLLAITLGKEELNAAMGPEDERAKIIELKASQISYLILATGVWITGGSMFFSATPMIMANIIMAFFIVAEATSFAIQLVYHRKGF